MIKDVALTLGSATGSQRTSSTQALLSLCLFIPTILWGAVLKQSPFEAEITLLPASLKTEVQKYSWHPGCPVPLEDLRYLKISYWGFDNQAHRGSLLVNKALAKEITHIFKALYEHRFPIERMELIDVFKGDDEASMAANNTSAFVCRNVTGQSGIFSQHSYGRAIDINPLINPYVKGKEVSPKEAYPYSNRKQIHPGMITENSFIYKIFTQHGWDWGGNWYDLQDYQHFEKRAKGEKRNPYGYKK